MWECFTDLISSLEKLLWSLVVAYLLLKAVVFAAIYMPPLQLPW